MSTETKIESFADLGAAIRQARRTAGITQGELAHRIRTSRQWVIRMEQGHSGVKLRKVLRALSELGLEMVAEVEVPPS